MKKTKKLLIAIFGIIFALSSCNVEHGYNSLDHDHAHELDNQDENESLDDKDDINVGNNTLGISVLSQSKTKADKEGVKFGLSTMATSSTDEGYGSITLQANYSPVGCLKDSIWSVSDTSALKVTPNAIDSSICVVTAIKKFDGEVTINVQSKFYSNIKASLKATYVGGFKIEIISSYDTLEATRKCAHSSTTLTDSPSAKSNFTKHVRIKYNGSVLSSKQIYNYFKDGTLSLSGGTSLGFMNDSTNPYFYIKDLTSSASTSKVFNYFTIKVTNDSSISKSLCLLSKVNVGSWETKTATHEVSYNCDGVFTKYDYTRDIYACDTCGENSSSSYLNTTCGKSLSGTRLVCEDCGAIANETSISEGLCTEDVDKDFYVCDVCGKYGDVGEICKHVTYGEEYLECEDCGWKTYDLSIDMCQDPIVWRYTCQTCGYETTDEKYKTSHEISTTVYRCSKYSLKGHVFDSYDGYVEFDLLYGTNTNKCPGTIETTCGSTIFDVRDNDGKVYWSCHRCGDNFYDEPSKCTNQITMACPGVVLKYTYKDTCNGTFTTSVEDTCGGDLYRKRDEEVSYGSFVKRTEVDTCGGSLKSESYNYSCSGTIVKKSEDYYKVLCNSCNRDGGDSDLGNSCEAIKYKEEEYNYCSVCNEVLSYERK